MTYVRDKNRCVSSGNAEISGERSSVIFGKEPDIEFAILGNSTVLNGIEWVDC